MSRRRVFNWARVFGAPPPDRVFLERIKTVSRRGNPGVRLEWTAEAGREWHGTGRTRQEAIRNMSNVYRMDFDSVTWKVRSEFGSAIA